MNNRRSFFLTIAAFFAGAAVNSSSIAGGTKSILLGEKVDLSEVLRRNGGSMSAAKIYQYLSAKNQ